MNGRPALARVRTEFGLQDRVHFHLLPRHEQRGARFSGASAPEPPAAHRFARAGLPIRLTDPTRRRAGPRVAGLACARARLLARQGSINLHNDDIVQFADECHIIFIG